MRRKFPVLCDRVTDEVLTMIQIIFRILEVTIDLQYDRVRIILITRSIKCPSYIMVPSRPIVWGFIFMHRGRRLSVPYG